MANYTNQQSGGGGSGFKSDYDIAPPTSQNKKANSGVAFRTDLSQVGAGRAGSSNRLFGEQTNIVDEERRLIDKVFNIVDKDMSGAIDLNELTEMFTIFGIESGFLSGALSRIMNNVDKDHDQMITPEEFYKLLSQKFEKNDARKDIDNVFMKMDKNRDKQLSVEELQEVATTLGETVARDEIKDMVKVFNLKYQNDLREYNKKKGNDRPKEPPAPPSFLTMEDFYQCMQFDLNPPVQADSQPN